MMVDYTTVAAGDCFGNGSKAEVEVLWEVIATQLSEAVDGALQNKTDPDSHLHVKETLIAFILTLEVKVFHGI